MGDHYKGDDWQNEQATDPQPRVVVSRQLKISAKCAVRYRLVGIHENDHENDHLPDDGANFSHNSDYSFLGDFSDNYDDYDDYDEENFSDWA